MIDLQNIPAEQHVLGAALLWPECVDEISLSAEDFAKASHATVWRTIQRILASGKTVDVITVAEELERADLLAQVGGLAYLSEMTHNTMSSANVKRHAGIIRDRAIRRSLLSALREIGERVEGEDMDQVLADAQVRIMNIGERAEKREPVRVISIASDRVNALDAIFNGNDEGVSTGLEDLDDMLGKVRPGDLVIIAGRPAMGKSAFAMQLLESMSSEARPGLFFSLEMTSGQLVDRLMASNGKVNLKKFRTAQFHDADWMGLTTALGRMQDSPIWIDDQSHELGQILATMRQFKRRHGLGVVVVDYIGLVQSKGDTREQEIASISRGLKLAAKQLGCPILALSQLNRKLEDRADKRPMMSDLRESGAIEQDADSVLMLYRDEVYHPDSPDKGVCEVLIRKNRHGETGMVPTIFRGDVVRFESFCGTFVPSYNTKSKTRRKENDL